MNIISAFAKRIIKEYKIDDSHGLEHAQRVMQLAAELINNEDNPIANLSRSDACNIITVAAYVHDLIDSKYIKKNDQNNVENELKQCLISAGISPNNAIYILIIIKNISFSKRYVRRASGKAMIDMAEIGYPELQLATEIVCDADMLDAYDIERCITFKVHQLGLPRDNPIILQHVKLVAVERLLRYKDEFMNTPAAKIVCRPLHAELQKYVDEKLAHVSIAGMSYDVDVLKKRT